MSLREYERKRHFSRTPEPKGRKGSTQGRSFVIQKHAARNLHYDFRLELDGVLKSWAVPKGPSLDTSVKRLAIHVEDHPVEYGAFEGTIPAGEYGGGTVMLWDLGSWEPIGDAHKGYQSGKLKFKLHGQKLHGAWMLLRTGGKAHAENDQKQWLLFKERDSDAKPTGEGDVLNDQPLSVSTRRSMEEIAADRDWVWGDKAKSSKKTKAAPARSKKTENPREAYDATKKEFAGVRMTSPDRVLYTEGSVTKLDLANYYRSIADWILPQIKGRPLVLVRCPDGQGKPCFYQKHPRMGTPDSLRQIPIREEKKTERYVVVDDVAGLISLAQISALEIHAWGCREDKLEQPDRLIFDLDPDIRVPWGRVVESAFQIRQFLLDLGLESFVKTTGGKGLHLVVPIQRRHDWEEAKDFCKKVAELIVRADPRRYTANIAKAARPGKIFIDYLRNGRGATAIAPYSTRARPGAPVSAPLTWDELSVQIPSDHFSIRKMVARLATLKRDPWEGIESVRQGLAAPTRKLLALS